jgi:hypothetical protein
MLAQSQNKTLLKNQSFCNRVLSTFQSWPLTLDTDDLTKKKLPGVYRAPTAEMLAYLDFSVSTTGMLAGEYYNSN